jgi:hypothetical protein
MMYSQEKKWRTAACAVGKHRRACGVRPLCCKRGAARINKQYKRLQYKSLYALGIPEML